MAKKSRSRSRELAIRILALAVIVFGGLIILNMQLDGISKENSLAMNGLGLLTFVAVAVIIRSRI